MQAIVLRDTHKIIGILQKHDFSQRQAEGITDVFNNLDVSGLASKEDIQEVKEEMYRLKIDLIKWVVGTQLAYGAVVISVLVALR